MSKRRTNYDSIQYVYSCPINLNGGFVALERLNVFKCVQCSFIYKTTGVKYTSL